MTENLTENLNFTGHTHKYINPYDVGEIHMLSLPKRSIGIIGILLFIELQLF